MGIETDLFVHPERISSQLICPICTQVLENPVQTSTEHLFCEDELLEWMTRSNLCPVTKLELVPSSIRKPGRIIMNMLGELERYCSNKNLGCTWVGPQEQLKLHAANCRHRPREELHEEIRKKNSEIKDLTDRLEAMELKYERLLEDHSVVKEKLCQCESKLRVYNAFLEGQQQDDRCYEAEKSPEPKEQRHGFGDVDKLHRLKSLNSLNSEKERNESKTHK